MYIFLFLLISQHLLLLSTNVLVPEISQNNDLIECINKISKYIKSRYVFVMSTVWNKKHLDINYKSSSIVIGINDTKTIFLKLERIEVFILTFQTTQQLSSWLHDVHLLVPWNPYGKFIISILHYDSISEVINILWEYYIINVYVILDNQVYTYFPYNINRCQDNKIAEHVFSCIDNPPDKIFARKSPNNLNGCKVKFLAYIFPPFVIDTNANRGIAKEAGIETAIVHTFATRMNFTEVYVNHNYTTWGSKLANGTYTDMYGDLQARTTDFILGMCNVDRNATDFEGLEQALIEHIAWWVPAAREQVHWTKLLNIFHYLVWILLIISTFLNGLIWWMFGKLNSDNEIYKTLDKCIEFSWKILLQSGVFLPKNTVMRLLVMCWFLFSILIYTAYQSQLISMLTKPTFEKQISNVQELLNSKLKYGFYGTVLRHFRDPEDPIQKQIFDNHIPCSLNEECLNRTAIQRDFAVLKTVKYTRYLIKKYYTDAEGRDLIYAFKDMIQVYPKFVVRKGYPLTTKFNELILSMHSNGLITKWESDVTDLRIAIINPKLIPLSIGHVLCAFLFLFVGLLLSVTVFILEIILEHFYKLNT